MTLVRRAFTAMGTSCELAVAASPDYEPQAQRALAAGLVEVETCERVLTRFSRAATFHGSTALSASGSRSTLGSSLRCARPWTPARRPPGCSTRRSSIRSSPPATTAPSPS